MGYICEKKILSEIMKKEEGEELIFSAVGPHTGDKFSDTMKKKIEDMEKNNFCLWAIKSSKEVDELKEWCKGKKEVCVILVENDTEGGNNDTVGGYYAVSTDDAKIKIPSDMCVTGAKSSQAYVVKKIIEITDGKDGNFSRSQYDEIIHDFHSNNQLKRFNPTRKGRKDYKHQVNYVLVLESPFIVKLNMKKC